jgi:16S rRNA U1498 N3-methylase RsmE
MIRLRVKCWTNLATKRLSMIIRHLPSSNQSSVAKCNLFIKSDKYYRCKKREVLKKKSETRKLMLYYKGMEKLDKEIDIVEMVKKFRKMDIIIK